MGTHENIISLDELKAHCSVDDAWIACNGVVYDITNYLDKHPGGKLILSRYLGQDCTDAFESIHRWVNISALVPVIGRLPPGNTPSNSIPNLVPLLQSTSFALGSSVPPKLSQVDDTMQWIEVGVSTVRYDNNFGLLSITLKLDEGHCFVGVMCSAFLEAVLIRVRRGDEDSTFWGLLSLSYSSQPVIVTSPSEILSSTGGEFLESLVASSISVSLSPILPFIRPLDLNKYLRLPDISKFPKSNLMSVIGSTRVAYSFLYSYLVGLKYGYCSGKLKVVFNMVNTNISSVNFSTSVLNLLLPLHSLLLGCGNNATLSFLTYCSDGQGSGTPSTLTPDPSLFEMYPGVDIRFFRFADHELTQASFEYLIEKGVIHEPCSNLKLFLNTNPTEVGRWDGIVRELYFASSNVWIVP